VVSTRHFANKRARTATLPSATTGEIVGVHTELTPGHLPAKTERQADTQHQDVSPDHDEIGQVNTVGTESDSLLVAHAASILQ
jgi:hypothetical protein